MCFSTIDTPEQSSVYTRSWGAVGISTPYAPFGVSANSTQMSQLLAICTSYCGDVYVFPNVRNGVACVFWCVEFSLQCFRCVL